MYCKLFASLYQGTLRGRSHEILVFTNLLANCDKDGFVDKHYRAIAEEVGLNIEEVKVAIANLKAPDPESRSHEYEGARIINMDEHREWGWKIVNYLKYRSIREYDDRKEQNRISQQRYREKQNSKPPSASVSQRKPRSAMVSHGKPPSAHTDIDTYREVDTINSVANVTEASKIKNQLSLGRKGSPTIHAGFEDFWSAYPKRWKKAETISEWNKIKPSRSLVLSMIQVLEAQKKLPDWIKDNGKWIPFPNKWLANRRWEDEISFIPKPSYSGSNATLITRDQL